MTHGYIEYTKPSMSLIFDTGEQMLRKSHQLYILLYSFEI